MLSARQLLRAIQVEWLLRRLGGQITPTLELGGVITGVVLARNEEGNIVDCLQSLRPHVSELILIDMESSDRTVELARPLVTKVLSHALIRNFDAARNISIGEAANDWLWFLDADERVPEQTGRLVNELVRERGHEFVALTIPFKSYFCGQWMQHCGWWPGYTMARVLKRGHFQFAERLHGGVQFNGREYRLPPDPELAIEHFSYRDIEQYIEKFNRYTSTEAAQLAEQGAQPNWEAAVCDMVRDLWMYYEANRGHLDGHRGWILSWLAGQYRWFAQAKLLDVYREHGQEPDPRNVPPSIDAVLELMERQLAQMRAKRPQLPLGIHWRSPLWDMSGYADDARTNLKALAQGERPVSVDPINWSENLCELPTKDAVLFKALTRANRTKFTAAITTCIPTLCEPDPTATLNILRTGFETDRIPSEWISRIHQFDEVWVWSDQNADSFRRSGVAPEKIRIVPSCIDTSLFTGKGRKLPLPEQLKDRFVFLSIFDWQFRKGWDVLLKAYCREFAVSDNTGLLLKISRTHGQEIQTIREQADGDLKSLKQSLAKRPDIVIWDERLTSEQLAALYRSVNAFVLPTRGEGLGRPYMEAMATGLPTIGTQGTGNDSFMTDKNSFLLPAKWGDVLAAAAAEIQVYRGHRWLEPSSSTLRKAMRTVFSDPKKRKDIGRNAARDIRSSFSLKHGQEAIEQALQAAESRFRTIKPPPVEDQQLRVSLEGELFAGHSFANINEKLLLEFDRDDSLALSVRRVQHNPTHDDDAVHRNRILALLNRALPGGPQVTIRHAFPPDWMPPETGKWVHIQPWEFGVLPLDWVTPLRNQVDEVWAPSSYVKRVYERSGVASDKIHVIPWGVDPDVFRPDALPLLLPNDHKFTFLFVGGTVARKGIDVAFQAFLDEFSKDEDVCLVIKDLGADTFYRYGNSREHILQEIDRGEKADIIYIDEFMTEGQLVGLYNACDCLVAPYRGEGFGMPILEAMACGLPPIVPRGGASDDFVSEKTAYLLPSREVECDHDWRLCGVGTELSVEVADVRSTMRHAFKNRAQTRRMGAEASRHVRKHFTWKNTAKLMSERMHALCRESPIESAAPPPAEIPLLSLCILVKDDERLLGDCLGRIRPFADEFVALDLGSVDSSPTICAEYGGRVYQGQLNGSYGQLRNLGIQKATSQWILVLDPEEWVHEFEARKIRPLLESLPTEILGVRVNVAEGEPVRLFRNQNQILFQFRGGERVSPSITQLGGCIVDSDITIRRLAPAHGDHRGRLRLLHLDLAEHCGNPLVLYSLGDAHYARGDFFHAECYLHECLQNLKAADAHFREAAIKLVDSYLRIDDPIRAHDTAQNALRQTPDDAEFARALSERLSQHNGVTAT